MSITSLILLHRDKWIAANKWADPELPYAALFMLSEYQEMMDESNEKEIATEAFDLAMMAMFTGLTLGEVLKIEPVNVQLSCTAEWNIYRTLERFMARLPDLVCRCNPAFTRNNPQAGDHQANLIKHLKGIIELATKVVALNGYDLNDIAAEKLAAMDRKRGL